MLDAPLILSAATVRNSTLLERIEAAHEGGFAGIGASPADRRRAHADGVTDADLVAALADHGVSLLEITGDAFRDWALDPADRDPGYERESEIFGLARALGGCYVIAGITTLPDPTDVTVERFGAICDRAAEHDLDVALEFLPFSAVSDASHAADIVRLAGRPNAGVLVDAWHHYRGGGTEEHLRSLRGQRVVAVQLDDADAEIRGSLWDDTLHHRRLPGEGALDLTRFLRILGEEGVDAPISVEVFSDELDLLPPTEAARRAGDATRTVLRAAFG
jgi:sugar phosphate isomerase/epimerase